MPVPDDEQRSGPPPALRPPTEPAPAQPEPAPPPAIDPEQVRQFQQFQQFQELMRQQGGQGLLPGPKRPLWKRILLGKLVRKLALLAIVLLGLYFAYDYYFGNDNDDLPASMTGGGTNKANVLHETTPKRTVRQVYSHIAQFDKDPQREPAFVCGQFEGGAEAQFANSFAAASCEAAVAKLHGEIDKSRPSWRNTYAEPFPGAELGEEPLGDTAVVDTCGLNPNMRLGVFSLKRIEHNQWVITGHERC